MKIYIIEIETRLHIKIQYTRVSQEGYKTLQEAQEWILSRSDKPVECDPFLFRSNDLTYSIREITIKEATKQYYKLKPPEEYYQIMMGSKGSGKTFELARLIHNEILNCIAGELEQLKDQQIQAHNSYKQLEVKNIEVAGTESDYRYYSGLAEGCRRTIDLLNERIKELNETKV